MVEDVDAKLPFDLIEIAVGEESVNARPVAWLTEIVDNEGHDKDGEFAAPSQYECTCPHCGSMMLFDAGYKSIQCEECDKGEKVLIEVFAPPFCDPGEYSDQADVNMPDSELEKIRKLIRDRKGEKTIPWQDVVDELDLEE